MLNRGADFINRLKDILSNIYNAFLDRDAYISIEYLHDCTDKEHKKILYKFSIYIEGFRTSKMIRDISVEDARSIYNTLLLSTKSVEIKRGVSSCYEYFIIPKWAVKKLAKDIKRNILS